MLEGVILVVGLLFLTVFVFVVWVCVRVGGLIFGALFGFGRRRAPEPPPLPQGWSSCANPACSAPNLSHARFCRRCGGGVSVPRRMPMRYVA